MVLNIKVIFNLAAGIHGSAKSKRVKHLKCTSDRTL